jgi:hypothetical protein
MWTPFQDGVPPTTIVHCHKDDFDDYIGRAGGPRGKWGNPFKIGVHGDRLTVIMKYEDWYLRQPKLMQEVPGLRGKRCGCWCAPKGGIQWNTEPLVCHGQVLAKFADGHVHIRTEWNILAPNIPDLYICSCGFTSADKDDWHWRDLSTLTGAEIFEHYGPYLPGFPLTRQQHQDHWKIVMEHHT